MKTNVISVMSVYIRSVFIPTLNDEVLNELTMEDALAENFCQLSLNALSGTDSGSCLKLKAKVKHKSMLILVDSGSSHNFVSENFLHATDISPVPAPARKVKVANGTILTSDRMVPDFP
jgi:hypothetical protein